MVLKNIILLNCFIGGEGGRNLFFSYDYQLLKCSGFNIKDFDLVLVLEQ